MPGYLRPEPETVLDAGYFDPVNKLRVSEGQALIDTDFEYGMQISKWENLELINNRPFTYSSSSIVFGVSSIQIATATPSNPSKTVTVTTTTNHGLTVGTEIVVQDTFLNLANGSFIIETVATPTTFTYSAKAPNYNPGFVQIFDPNKTAIYFGTLYSNARIGGPANFSNSDRFVTVTTTVPHGLALGNEIAVTGITAAGGFNPPNGSFFVISVINETTFRYYANVAPSGNLSTGNVYVRPQGSFLHRPFDGGIIFSANASSNNQQAIRQTRRYFRYQSGKGLQISSGTVLKPNLSIESLQYNSTTELVTVQTKEQHNIQPGTTLKIDGAKEPEYNGTFSVVTVTGYNTFTYAPPNPKPTKAKASGAYYAVVEDWYGCTNRLGMFDSQNGMFFEYDGQDLYAVKRSSTYQISGRVTVTNGSNTVTQTNVAFPTSFTNQLEPGDFIVIRGQSYRVETITSDTEMKISPSYRGGSTLAPTAQFVQVAKTIDTKVPQSEWNIDTMDGNGPSGFTLELTKMQMFYIDYSWYGAGFVRWGLRGLDGTVYYVHKLINNNTNSEAYMRSGNLPGRYESNTFGKVTSLTQSIATDSQNTIAVKSTEGFSPSGTLLIRSGTDYEYVNYAAKTSTSFTGVVREKNGATIEVSITQGSNKGTVATIAGIQVGQRVLHPSFPDNTYVSNISGNEVTFNTAALQTNPNNVIFSAMTNAVAKVFILSPTQPVVSVEQAFPTYSASMSHWGTSVIMDGRFDDDKSLLFTFGQTQYINIPASATVTESVTGLTGTKDLEVSNSTSYKVGMVIADNTAGFQNGTTILSIAQPVPNPNNKNIAKLSLSLTQNVTAQNATFSGGNNRALFSIRVAPSVDNGIAANFGQRDLINRMQLTLRTLGVTTKTADANMLVTAILNGVPSGSTTYQNAVRNSTVLYNSSLAQFADYQSSQSTIVVTGGELTGGFYVQGTDSIALDTVRDLGNSILGGGGISTSTGVYPDGPDVLTILVTNLSSTAIDVLGRIGWSEAQA
jgi:hypothetical protein